MRIHTKICAYAYWFLMLAISSASFAQNVPAFRPAQETEFIGYWRILLIPDEKLNLKIHNKDTGFADPCQILVHRKNGDWINITIENGAGEDESRRRCLLLTKKEVDLHLYASQASNQMQWKKFGSKMFMIQDTRTQEKRYWVVDYTLRDLPLPDYFDFKKGDLLMNMAIPAAGNQAVLAWRMVLRPIPDSLETP